MKKISLFSFILAGLLISSCDKDDDYDSEKPGGGGNNNINQLKAAGDSAAIIGTINQFRKILGDSLNVVPGKTSGRREINWDGVPANLTNNNNFPPDFFNLTDPAGANGRKRGLVYLATSSPLRLDSSSFKDIDASYASQFNPFSQKKAIISANSTVSEIVFKVPGTNTDASVQGFGIVFSDVDEANSTTLQFFDGNKDLGTYKAQAKNGSANFSFLGVHFPNDKVTRIRITAGNGVLAAGTKDVSNGGNKDLVVYDDFFYDEPKPLQ
ncbi:MAG: hypothetical protein EOO01_10185 [Chitinophagaceae bacterium]|nr:MAG: hypothetical protein EOO01_10185 [Chitinophagaceae bacterium]